MRTIRRTRAFRRDYRREKRGRYRRALDEDSQRIFGLLVNNATITEQYQEHQFLRECPDVYAGGEAQRKRFVEAVLCIPRSGAQWRRLPAGYGKWNTVCKRFARWRDRDVWGRMHQHFMEEPDMEYLSIDSTVVRARQCAAGAPGKGGAIIAGSGQKPRGMQRQGSRERGRTGQSAEIHAARGKSATSLRLRCCSPGTRASM